MRQPKDSPIPVNEKGECIIAKEVPMEAGSKNEEEGWECGLSAQSKMWECSKHCKPLSEFEVNAIVCFRTAVEKVRQALAECDVGCPYGHYTKIN